MVLLRYTGALAIQAVLALLWYSLPEPWSRLPVPILIVTTGVIVRYFGDGPGIAAIIFSAGVLWFHIYPSWSRSPLDILARIAVFVLGAVIIAAISRRGSQEKRDLLAARFSLTELAPDGILCATATGTILYVNPALRRMLGITSDDQVIGHQGLDVVHPDSRELVTRRMSERPLGDAGYVIPWMEEKWRRVDGSAILVEVSAVSVRNHGRIGWLAVVRDLTERKKAEADLHASNDRFRALFENAIDAIVLFDDNGRYIDANAAAVALLGYSREEILMKSVGDFSSERGTVPDLRMLATQHMSGNNVLLRKDGETRDVEYRSDPNIVPGTHCIFFIDVTDRLALERTSQQLSAKLLESQDEERRRIARQLHETTAQTLAALKMNLHHLRDAIPADVAKALLTESIDLTDQGIREVRTLSHLLYPPLIEDVGVVAALRWYVTKFSERSGIKVQLDAPADLERFPEAIENGIFRIVQEALTNIHRHSGSAVARVALTRESDELHIVIEDEGKGMPVTDPGKPLAGGVGIATMQERAKELGGRFQIASREKGTRIDVTLRVAGNR